MSEMESAERLNLRPHPRLFAGPARPVCNQTVTEGMKP